MKKTFLLSAATICLAVSVIAQTSLPTSWSFDGTSPNGWTTSGTAYYTGSGNTPPALKFDNTGDWLQIFFSDDPGPLTYYLTGNSFSGGTFAVEQSVNGTAWTTLRTFTSPPVATYTLFTDSPNAASRYIRFIYTTKVSGNIGLDDVNLAVAPPTPVQEINVKLGTANIINGGTAVLNSPVITMTPTTFVIENLGTVDTLNITSATIGGVDAADFAIGSSPTTVVAGSSENLVINFTPSDTGTRNATLTIANNDSNEDPYIINLYGVGGSFATEPTAQAANLAFTNIKSYRFSASFTAASPSPDGYLILRKNGSPITDVPTDGTVYTNGDTIGNSQVLFSGTTTSFVPNNIVASNTYYFAVFTYNGPGQYRNYLQINPLTNNVTSSGNMAGNYYLGISVSSATFITDLSNKINPHTSIYYSNYATTMVPLFESRDTTGGQKVVTCVYSGYNYVYTEPYSWSVMSREHTYAHSWMPSYPADSPVEKPEYNDQHHLFPTEFSNANQVRSNYPLGEVVNVSSQFLNSKFGTDANGRNVFEPRDEHKGDAARALMYMAVCYNGVGGLNWKFKNPISGVIPYGQDQDVLKKWHYQDPPDNWEIARNDFLDSLQGNRNPFIDSVQFACYIDFSTMTKIASPDIPCNTVGIFEKEKHKDFIILSPNPNNGNFRVNYKSALNQKVSMKLYDGIGRVVYNKDIKVSAGNNSIEMDVTNLNNGIYILEFVTKTGKQIEKLVKE